MFAQLWCPAGDVDNVRPVFFDPVADAPSGWFLKHLGPPRCRVHMAMPARLVAFAADIQLKRDERGAPQLQAVPGKFFIESIHPRDDKGWTRKGNAIMIGR